MIFPNSANPRIELVATSAYSKDGEYVPQSPTDAYAAYDAQLGEGMVRPRPGLTLKWTPPKQGTLLAFCSGKYTGNKTYRLTVTNPAGTFKISDGTSQTPDLSGSLSAQGLSQSLVGLSLVESGDAQCYGQNLDKGPLYIELVGQYAGKSAGVPTLSIAGANSAGAVLTLLRAGGTFSEVVAAVQHGGSVTLYSIDTASWTHKVLASGLPVEAYDMVQYGDSVYVLNKSFGLTRYRLGGVYADGYDPAQSPPAPTAGALSLEVEQRPYISVSTTPTWSAPSWAGCPMGVVVMQQATQFYASGTVNSSSHTLNQTNTVEFLLSPSVDFSDVLFWNFGAMVTNRSTGWTSSVQDAVLVTASSEVVQPVAAVSKDVPYMGGRRRAMWGQSARSKLKSVAKVRMTVSFSGVKKGDEIVLYALWWRSPVDIKATPSDLNLYGGDPPEVTHTYAMAYKSPTGAYGPVGAETRFTTKPPNGPVKVTMKSWFQGNQGGWKAVALRLDDGGVWRRLPDADGQVAAAMSDSTWDVAFRDTVNLTDLQGCEAHTASGAFRAEKFAGYPKAAMGTWKGCLAIGVGHKVWVSSVGDPERYAPDPDDMSAIKLLDPYDESQGVTFYASNNRAEEVVAIVGQDNLFVCTEDGVSTCSGDLPIDLTPPRRLPGSAPLTGVPCGWRNGIVAPTAKGLLLHQASRGFDGIDPMQASTSLLTENDPAAWRWLMEGGPSRVFTDGVDTLVIAGSRGLWLDERGVWTRCRFPAPAFGAVRATPGIIVAMADGRLALWDPANRGTDFGVPFKWTIEAHRVLGTRVALKEIKASCSDELRVQWDADGEAGAASGSPGAYDIPAHEAPPCRDLKLSWESGGTLIAGHVLLQEAYGGKRD